jgi:hypothetical protein
MYKSTTKCNETLGKWCKNKHGASKIIDTFETYQWCTQPSSLKLFKEAYKVNTKIYPKPLHSWQLSQPLKTRGLTKPSNIKLGVPTSPTNLWYAPLHTFQESLPLSTTDHLQDRDLSIDLGGPAIDTTTTPDSSTALHESIKSYQT